MAIINKRHLLCRSVNKMKNEKINLLKNFCKNKNISRIVFSLGINGIVLCLLLISCDVFYEMDDDVVFAKSVVDGFYDTAYISSFLLKFMGFIQNLIYPYCSFVIVSISFAYLACVTITNVMVEKFDYYKAAVITIFINGIFAVNYYLTISFTRLPALLATAGFLSIVHCSKKKRDLIGIIWGIILVVVASLYRYNVYFLVFGFAVAFVGLLSIIDFINLEKSQKNLLSFIKIVFEPKRLISAILVFVFAISLNTMYKNSINNSKEMLYYKQYTSARSLVYDFPIPTYDQEKEAYDSIGISENDIALFKHSYVDDNGPFTIETFKEMRSIQENYNDNNKTIVSVVKKMLISELQRIRNREHEALNVFAFLITLFMFLITQNKKRWFIPVLLSVVVLGGYLYIYNTGRAVYRVLFPIVFSSLCFLIYMFENNVNNVDKKKMRIKNTIVGVLCILIACSGFCFSYTKNYHSTLYPMNEEARKVVSYAKENSDKKYVIQQWYDFSAMLLDNVSSVFYAERSDYNKNYIVTSGVYYASPMYEKYLEGFGTKNVYEELLKENVYFISNKKDNINEIMRVYLQEHYSDGEKVIMKKIDDLGNYVVYDYVIE